MIIGLTGRNGSGKGEVAKFLQKAGFASHSLSDILRAEIRSRRLVVTRERLIATGVSLREKEGLGVLAERTLEGLTAAQNHVIDSIRNPEEVRTLRKGGDFFLLHITAPRKIRFERTRRRSRESDPRTEREFVLTEEREFRSANPAAQQLLATERLADAKIDNRGGLEALHEKVRKVLLRFAASRQRPPWDTYFMEIARRVALRSNCVKRGVAAVIVKDRRVIATGYNGTPRGVKNCNEGGCPRCRALVPSGSRLDECLCSHAEENAITQSAYHGVNLREATLYTTFSPCLICTKMIINAGIHEVVYDGHYPLVETAKGLLKEAKVTLRRLLTPKTPRL